MRTSGAVAFLLLSRVDCLSPGRTLQACSLMCENGGTCTFVSDDELVLKNKVQSGKMVQRCVCPVGFKGMGCEIQDKGSNCDGADPSSCDCAEHDKVSRFAGMICRKNPFPEYCGDEYDPFDVETSFCVNGGKCKGSLMGAQLFPGNTTANKQFRHLGCFCPKDFYGPHCELLNYDRLGIIEGLGAAQQEPSPFLDTSTARKRAQRQRIISWTTTLAFLALMSAVGWIVCRRFCSNLVGSAKGRYQQGKQLQSPNTYFQEETTPLDHHQDLRVDNRIHDISDTGSVPYVCDEDEASAVHFNTDGLFIVQPPTLHHHEQEEDDYRTTARQFLHDRRARIRERQHVSSASSCSTTSSVQGRNYFM